MFQVSDIERENIMRSQIVTASPSKTNLRFRPFAFTELGIGMLAGVLKSDKAVEVHISIIRTFFRLRQLLQSNQELAEKIANLEQGSNQMFKLVFERLESLETENYPVIPR